MLWFSIDKKFTLKQAKHEQSHGEQGFYLAHALALLKICSALLEGSFLGIFQDLITKVLFEKKFWTNI